MKLRYEIGVTARGDAGFDRQATLQSSLPVIFAL